MLRHPTTLLLACTLLTHADPVATVLTETGGVANAPILVTLQSDTAPQAVANFIRLSQGTQDRIDPTTGKIITTPMYIGEKFFRVINDAGFKIAQTGSGTGTNSGGPGYTFEDEFSEDVRHTSYGLSMANSGPNSNGSQIFFTGGIAHPTLDDVHSIIGLITDIDSQGAIDTILGAGNNGSSITGISITEESEGPTLAAFDPNSQNLPTLTDVSGKLQVDPGNDVTFQIEVPLQVGDLLSVYRSTDLTAWSHIDDPFAGYDNSPVSSPIIDDGSEARAFYQMARIHHPNSPTPSNLANRTIFIDAPGAGGTITLTIDGTGQGGTCTYTGNGSTGSITRIDHNPGGYGAVIIAETTNLIPLLIKLGYDGETATHLTGRHSLSGWQFDSNLVRYVWNSFGSGTMTVTK